MTFPQLNRQRIARAAILLVSLFLAYYFAVPCGWPIPEARIAHPDRVVLGEDLPLEVALHAWHGNSEAYLIRVSVDRKASTCVGSKGIFDALFLLDRPPRLFEAGRWRKQWTWPIRRAMDFSVPLADLAKQGKLGPGDLVGRVDVIFTYDPGLSLESTPQEQTSIPFKITVEPAE